MKFALVILALVFGAWLWRRNRKPDAPATPPTKPASEATPMQHMVACAHCGVHLPAADAVPHGPNWYCCNAHFQQHTRPPAGEA